MKRKLFFGLAGGMLVTFSILSVNTSLSNTGDISLKNIAVMAQASAEVSDCPTGCYLDGDGCFCYTYYLDYKKP